MNIELLRRVQQHILDEPRRFVMGSFVQQKDLNNYVYDGGMAWEFPVCGTAACIGGWAAVLSERDLVRGAAIAGQQALGLSDEEAARLFYMSQWPKQFIEDWRTATKAGSNELRAKCGADRIEHFIMTEGKE